MTTKEITDIKTMASTAGIYLHSAQTLERISLEMASRSSNISVKSQSLADIISTFLLFSLSSEISLKVILKCEGKNSARAHDLQALFSLIDTGYQEEIKSNVNSADFDSLLTDHKDNFVSWRYFYEGNANPIKVPFLKDFATSAYQLARKLVIALLPDNTPSA